MRFDDLLVASVSPDQLEEVARRHARLRAKAQGPPPGESPSRAQIVRLKRADAGRRLDPKPVGPVAPTVSGWKLQLRHGDQVRTTPLGRREDGSAGESVIAYGLRRDEAGKPLPIHITITADVAFQPGIDLARLHWEVRHVIRWPDGLGAVVAEGDFRTGLVQSVVIPSEWADKATTVRLFPR